VLEHNTAHPARPVYVLGDDVYAGSYLTSGRTGLPIGAVTGTHLGEPGLGRMSDWTASSVDAYAVLLHYGGADRDSGIAMLPSELFGHRDHTEGFLLRGTLAADQRQLRRFTDRLHTAAVGLASPDGPATADQAMKRARLVADIDTILAHSRY
jgi:hypothetical protein